MSAVPATDAVPFAWENHEFKMATSIVGSQIDKKPAPASNKFKFLPSNDGGTFYLYTLMPTPDTDDMRIPWVACKLLPQTGPALQWPFTKLNPNGGATYEQNLQNYGMQLYNSTIKNNPNFDRLVGFLKTFKADGSEIFNPISIYRVQDALTTNKVLLLAYVRLVGGNPVGTVAAND
jgi:hypothetical protein